MNFGPLAFLSPAILGALIVLPAIWWLLRASPPEPQRIWFPAIRLLRGLQSKDRTPERSPWWLTLLRLLAAAALIFALAEPILDSDKTPFAGEGPVVAVVDNGWASAAHWQQRTETLATIIANAGRAGRPVLLVPTAATIPAVTPVLEAADAARDRLNALKPRPYEPNRAAALEAARQSLNGVNGASLYWLTDGVAAADDKAFMASLLAVAGSAKNLTVIEPSPESRPLALRTRLAEGGELRAEVLRPGGGAVDAVASALSARGQALASVPFSLAAGATSAEFGFELPVELRNQISRVAISAERSAAAVSLIDSGSRWNRIALVAGIQQEQAQPLLSPLHYLDRALRPFAELITDDGSTATPDIAKLLDQHPNVLVLADVGKVGGAQDRIERFVEGGGVLIRFAGPRLEQAGDTLMPVQLRGGERNLGGALSWSSPQPLARFEDLSLFTGLKVPDDVRVSRQVLADPALLDEKTQIWARLADGTPLVTARQRKTGWIVLFHVTANSDWSNLPLSGLFVDMLKRVIGLTGLEAGGGKLSEAASGQAASNARVLSPVETLDGFGDLGVPPPEVQAIAREALAGLKAGPQHPPGLYGPSGSTAALNAIDPKQVIAPITEIPAGVTRAGYRSSEPVSLKPWLYTIALSLLFLDVLATMLLRSGGLVFGNVLRRSAATILILGTLGLAIPHARADTAPVNDQFALDASGKTRLAYVMTGDSQTDEVSRQGLAGLNTILEARTAVEPGEPIGIDVTKDELAFFPVIYWPVREDAKELDDGVSAKIDAYMKNGGMIVFDTRDEGDRAPSADGDSPASAALQRLLGKLDVPRLQAAPTTHVLTKSFYLLRDFPGRWDGSPLWVEAGDGEDANLEAHARQSDGVSAIIVTANDFAAAWAVDANGSPLYPCVPGGEEQREFAYRTGVNIVMYALTGNYKADQVHVPALLERLGQ